jgi:hypothetical protein
MPDIASLSLHVQQLEGEYAWWSTVTLWLAGGTALVVVLYGISTYVANYKNGQLRAAQSALSRAKEEQLTQALKEKEEQIAVAQAQAARANESAAENEQKIIELGRLAESEHRARLRLEEQIAPRRLTATQKAQLVQLLKEEPAAVIIVSRFMDPEASDFASDFESALQEADWQTQRMKNHTAKKYGVFIGMVAGTSVAGAKRLSDALTAMSVPHEEIILSADDPTISPGFQPDTLYLLIGAKP